MSKRAKDQNKLLRELLSLRKKTDLNGYSLWVFKKFYATNPPAWKVQVAEHCHKQMSKNKSALTMDVWLLIQMIILTPLGFLCVLFVAMR